jgi:hypothetical protein
VAKLFDRIGFYLPNALAGYAKFLPDLFKRVVDYLEEALS